MPSLEDVNVIFIEPQVVLDGLGSDEKDHPRPLKLSGFLSHYETSSV